MALTDKDKHETLHYLGWPSKALVTNSTHYHKTIADRFEDLATEAEDIARRLLRQLQAIDSSLEEARCRLAASKVDDITLNKREIECLRSERRRYRNELHRVLDIPVLTNDGRNISVVV